MSATTAAAILCVRDVAAACEFYDRAFGFARLRYFDGNDAYAVVGSGDAQIHLIQSSSPEPHNVRGIHVADVFVWVSDIAPVVERAVAAELSAERGPEHYDSEPVGTTEAVFSDVDGNWICFGQAD